jgi:hypothetical protein
MMMTGAGCGLLAMLLERHSAAAESAPSQPPSGPSVDKLDLEWTAPAECPTRAHVLAELERMAPRRIEREARAQITVTGGARDTSGNYRAHVTLRVGSALDERDVEGATCLEIADASALLVALALVPEALPTESTATKAEARPIALGPSSRHAELHVGAGVGVEAFVLPRPVPTLRAALGIQTGPLHLGVEGFISSAVDESLANDPNKGASFRLLGARLTGCWLFGTERLHAGPCAGVEATGISAEGFGLSRPLASTTWALNPAAGARLSWKPAPRVEAVFAIVTKLTTDFDFSVDSASGSRQLHHVPPVTLGAGIGIARLWALF